ncbi:carboxylesterase family protein, partial [Pseudonocardia pini]|uniref:carboxylesterase family protein n=1 Tax=Pseudonocardia pini TaxID=2758030 RepID=UPI001C690356
PPSSLRHRGLRRRRHRRVVGLPTLEGNALLAGHGLPVYGYEFADPTAPNVNGVTTPEVPQGAAHATDVPYLFDLNGRNLLTTPAQQRLADRMIGYWTTFARTGSPGQDWPALRGPEGPTLWLPPEGRMVDPGLIDLGAEHRCALWAQLPGGG